MTDLAYEYYNQLDSLDSPDLEILSDKISKLILAKKKNSDYEIKDGLAYFNSIKGSVNREINEKEELVLSLEERYSYS